MSASAAKRPYFYSCGKRKTAIARVRLFQDGNGAVQVNGMPLAQYFAGVQIENVLAPLAIAGLKSQVDVEAQIIGGGKMSQSDALRHGISRALLLLNPEYRPELKRAGFLRRDARVKERKKPGLKRARRAPQFSKR
ncbi:MAG: small subunit ribosomal protein S9 [Candidatus Peregrinibacteria bacterium Gr01-1014_25]|nr:MAG: small subunit ribosomal protein S9 [Candidatus Peregrinibacteria bacterium Gr01-1014_25]